MLFSVFYALKSDLCIGYKRGKEAFPVHSLPIINEIRGLLCHFPQLSYLFFFKSLEMVFVL